MRTARQVRTENGTELPRGTARPRCTHPSVARELHNGYDVTCGDCEAILGRVAVFPDAVLGAAEARELLGMIGANGEGSGVRAKVERAASRG